VNTPRCYCAAAARAIWELDQCSLRAPQTGDDKRHWHTARKLLCGILERNGFQFAEPGSRRIKKLSSATESASAGKSKVAPSS